MYWACMSNESGIGAIIYSANDPGDTSEAWDESWPYETEEEAGEALDGMRESRDERRGE